MSIRVNREPAQSLKGGVIMDVVTPEQAKIAEAAGAVAVMALERVPADIRAQGGVARMSDPGMIAEIQEAVSIPVMAKARIGHFVEAQILAELGIDFIDESEVLTPADYVNHINKWELSIPTLCGATNLGEALRRIAEGAAMIRSKGDLLLDGLIRFRRVRSLSVRQTVARSFRAHFPRGTIPIRPLIAAGVPGTRWPHQCRMQFPHTYFKP